MRIKGKLVWPWLMFLLTMVFLVREDDELAGMSFCIGLLGLIADFEQGIKWPSTNVPIFPGQYRSAN